MRSKASLNSQSRQSCTKLDWELGSKLATTEVPLPLCLVQFSHDLGTSEHRTRKLAIAVKSGFWRHLPSASLSQPFIRVAGSRHCPTISSFGSWKALSFIPVQGCCLWKGWAAHCWKQEGKKAHCFPPLGCSSSLPPLLETWMMLLNSA